MKSPSVPHVALVAHDVHDDGGMERSLAELIRHAQGEVRFTVVSSTLQPDLREVVDWKRVPLPRRPFPLKFLAFWILGGARLAAVRSDLSHAMGAIVPQRIDVSTVQFCHAGFARLPETMSSEGLSMPRRVNRFVHRKLALVCERWCFRAGRVRTFVAVSSGIEDELIASYPARPVVVAPNGVDTQRFRPDREARNSLRNELGVDDAELVAVFVGGDWDRKGLDIAIEALARSGGSPAPWELWIVGGGQVDRYRHLAESAGVAERVRFIGRRSDTERFYQAADAFVFPTLYEAFPLVSLEAAACGLPLVATPVNGIDELVSDGQAGIRAPRTVDGVADALRVLGSDADLREQLGRTARQRALSYTWAAHADAIVGAYQEIMGSRVSERTPSGDRSKVTIGTR